MAAATDATGDGRSARNAPARRNETTATAKTKTTRVKIMNRGSAFVLLIITLTASIAATTASSQPSSSSSSSWAFLPPSVDGGRCRRAAANPRGERGAGALFMAKRAKRPSKKTVGTGAGAKLSTPSEVYDADRAAADLARAEAAAAKRRRRRGVGSRRNGGASPSSSSSLAEKDDPEWKFFDTARLHASGGDGGNGCVAFRREKGEPMGGPAGGRGGSGGSVYLVCDSSLNTLAPVRNKVHVRGTGGRNGIGKNKDGKGGRDVEVRVPPGTTVRELHTQKVAGELREDGDRLLVARGGRGGRGNAAFMTNKRTAPRLAERGEPGAKRWLGLELRLVADVGFLGKPNAGKSTLLASATSAKPKIADYPFTTIVPNLGVCDLPGDEGAGLVLCDIPGLIEGAADGVGMGSAFLRHVQRCKVLLHVVDGTSDDPLGDFTTINRELREYDPFLADKPQVVVLNKIDVPEVSERMDDLLAQLREAAGHTRVLPISAATTERVSELMGRLKKFVDSRPVVDDLPPIPEVDFSLAALEADSDSYEIQSDPAYPGQWRISGDYIEQVAKMTHWEYPEAVERFGRQLEALGIAAELERRGAVDGDLVMVGEYDFDFAPGMSNPYIPPELLEEDARYEESRRMYEQSPRGMLVDVPSSGGAMDDDDKDGERPWRPFPMGGFLDVDTEELQGFDDEDGEWDMLMNAEDADFGEEGELLDFSEDEVWTSS